MDVVDGYIKGADFYLTKPFEPQMLLDAVAHYIGNLPMSKREQLDQAMLGAVAQGIPIAFGKRGAP